MELACQTRISTILFAMQSLASYLLFLSSIPLLTTAVYTDEAYRTDYHYPFLGTPREPTTFFHRPHSGSKASLLYTLSEKLVLGAINPKDGTLIWRHSLNPSTSSSNGFLRAGEDENIVISALGGKVTAWDAAGGKAVWSNEFVDGDEVKDLEVLALQDGSDANGAKDSIVLFARGTRAVVRRLDGKSGDVVWEFSHDSSDDVPFQVSTTASAVYAIFLHGSGRAGYKTRVISLDPLTGKQNDRLTLNSEAEVLDAEAILYVGANVASPIIAWTDMKMKVLKVNIIGSKHISTFKIPGGAEEKLIKISIHAPHLIQSRPHFLVHYQTATSHWAEVYHIDLVAGTIVKAYDLPKIAGSGAFATTNLDANVYFTRTTETEIVLVSSASHGVLGRWPVSLPREIGPDGKDRSTVPVHAVAEVVARPGYQSARIEYAVRCALVLSSGDWILIRNGEHAWSRAEALAGAVAAEWAEPGPGQALIQDLKMNRELGVLPAYVHRVKRHAQELSAWLPLLPARIKDIITKGQLRGTTDKDVQLDKYGFQKHVIVATDNGRLYALDTGNQGNIVWGIQAVDLGPSEKWDVKGIFAENDKARVMVRGARGEQVTVDLKTGHILSSGPGEALRIVESTTIVDAELGQYVTEIYEDGKPGEAPTSQVPLSVITGTRFIPKASTLHPTVMWEFTPGPGERITSLTTRPTHDPVASIGRVLGDRSVMYKYLNPNLLLITSVNDASATLSLHLLDSISGQILHSTTHPGVDPSRPISAVMSENWFVYSFWGDLPTTNGTSHGLKGHQLAVAELYDSPHPNDRGVLGAATNFSSLHPASPKPHVLSTTFAIPEPLSALAVTQTRQGITSRSILAVLPLSHGIISIPKAVLDPRRPSSRDATPAEQEEGLLRRSAALDFDPKWIVSHRRHVVLGGPGSDSNIITSPTLLESTSLVFVYGLDIFGTRVAPSAAFDMLGQDFGRSQLVLTILALGAGVLVLAPLVS
ncbi:MAG: hypothetical protein M1816_006616 [Peltula sp. TS41687]|nr:MAG: hypothetical protein M1816_006616 [Peltula sp. TS41687]